jgi:uncharacterized membrane protein
MAHHPRLIHPVISQIPNGLWITSFLFDLLFFQDRNPCFATASYYSILAGVLLAIAFSPIGMKETLHARKAAGRHMALSLVTAALFLVGFFARHSGMQGTRPDITLGSLTFSVLGLCLASASTLAAIQLLKDESRPLPSTDESSEEKRLAA